MENINFVHPQFFWLFTLIPLLVGWWIWQQKNEMATLLMSSNAAFANHTTWRTKTQWLLKAFRLLALSALIIALARPRTTDVTAKIKTSKGIDIVMAMDVSGSMLARDLKPNRLEALKNVAATFIKDRVNDRIGLVVYAGESYTRTPVTSDKTMLLESLKTIQYDDTVIEDGTGIGVGLATSINRLKQSKAKSRVIILLTDGKNNRPAVDPVMAAEIAKEYGLKVYTIGLGTNGTAPFPFRKLANGQFEYKNMPVEIDEKLMKEIAQKTGGKYFRATSNKKLKEIYKEINKLETIEIKENRYYNYDEKFKFFIALALGFLMLELILKQTIYKSFI